MRIYAQRDSREVGVFAQEDNNDTLVEDLKAPIEHAFNFVLGHYDDAYAYAYDYIVSEEYVGIASGAIDTAIEALDVAINGVDLGDFGALEADVKVELEAAKATLVEVKAIVNSGDLAEVDGLVSSIFALEDDLYTHLYNANVALAQATSDATPYVVEAIATVEAYVAEEVVPALLTAAEEFAQAAVDYFFTNIDDIYYSIPGVAADVYENVLETVILVYVYVGNAIEDTVDFVVTTYYEVLDLAWALHDNREEAIAFAQELYVELLAHVAEMDGKYDLQGKFETVFGLTVEEAVELLETLGNHIYDNKDEALEAFETILATVKETGHAEVAKALELYNVVLNVLEGTYGNTADIVTVTTQIFSYVYDFVVGNNTFGEIKEHCDNIVDLIAATYGETKDLEIVVAQIYAYAVEIFNGTFSTDYELTVDSLYVSLGNATYGEELAEMLHLGNKYHNFGLDEDYLDTLADADFVTVRIDNGEIIEFAISQATNYGTELDWNNYLDAEGQAALADVLAAVKAELIRNGKAAEYAVVVEALINEQFGSLATVTLNDEFVASVAVYAIESALYAYAGLIERLETVLADVYATAPNATVVITGVQNPLADLGVDLGEYAGAVEAVLDIFNAQLVAVAYANENTIYVDSTDAADIYAALTVTCAHVYTDCEDTTCDLCGEVRVAPGHKYGEWCVVKEAAVGVEGSEERTCSVCGHVDVRSIDALPAPIPEENTPAPQPEPKKNHTGLVIGILVAVAAVAGVLVYRKKKANPAPSEEEKKETTETK